MASAGYTFVEGGVVVSTITLHRVETAAPDIWCNLAMDWPEGRTPAFAGSLPNSGRSAR
jgi:hypothetical protein